jgi:hypothetical protein
MASKLLVLALAGLAALCTASAQTGQEKPLTNADVVNMVKAGISESTIVLAIQKGPTQFETGADALIRLKRVGVTDKLLAAMLGSAAGARSESPIVATKRPTGAWDSAFSSPEMRVGNEELTRWGVGRVFIRLLQTDPGAPKGVEFSPQALVASPQDVPVGVALALAEAATRDLSPTDYRAVLRRIDGDRVAEFAKIEYAHLCYTPTMDLDNALVLQVAKLPDCLSKLKQKVSGTKIWIGVHLGDEQMTETTAGALGPTLRAGAPLAPVTLPTGGVIGDFAYAGGLVLPPTAASVPERPASSTPSPIDEIRSGLHQAMPPAHAAPSALRGMSGVSVTNGTKYELSVYLKGPVAQTLEIAPDQSQNLTLPPGHYEVAARVSDPGVIPFYGTDDYGADTTSSYQFYIQYRAR